MSRSFNSFSNGGLSRVKNTAGSKRVTSFYIRLGFTQTVCLLCYRSMLYELSTDLLYSQNFLMSLALTLSFLSTSLILSLPQNPILASFFIGRRLSSLERSIFFKSVAVLDFLVIKGFTVSESNDFNTDLTCQ